MNTVILPDVGYWDVLYLVCKMQGCAEFFLQVIKMLECLKITGRSYEHVFCWYN